MKMLRRAAIVLLILVVAGLGWIWWNRPGHTDLATHVPADAMVYLEADSIPAITEAVSATAAWRALAPAAGIRGLVAESGWIGRLMAWTGIGPAESVVLSRAQIAVVAVGIDAAPGEDALHVKPRYGLVVDTHTGESRTLQTVESQVGKFAARTYGNPLVERKLLDGVHWITWTAPAQDRRIVAAVTGSLAIVARDESVIRACLDAKNGARPNLAGNPVLQEMRQRMKGNAALAFGFVSPAGVARLFDLYAPPLAAQITEDPERQELALKVGSEVARKTFGPIGWSARVAGGGIEDRYFVSLDPLTMQQLAPGLKAQADFKVRESELLPPETYSLTHYNLADPPAGWNGLNGALTARLDAVYAVAIPVLSARLLETYGIDDPGTFMSAADGQMVTARLEDRSGSTVTLIAIKNEPAIRAAVQKRLGTAKSERVGEVDILVSNDPRRGAAAFVGDVLLLGPREMIRRCLEARSQSRTISGSVGYTQALAAIDRSAPPVAYTLTNDSTAARDFILAVASRRLLSEREPDAAQLTAALEKLAYVVTETRVVEGGLERRTRSSFGQFGAIATQYAGGR